MKIDNVNNFAKTNTAIITEHDFKSEYSFRMCSVVTNLVRSLEFERIRCATTLCHFGGIWNGYVAAHFILLSSTAESSAASGYVLVPERFDQNGKPASRNEERTSKKPSFFPAVDLFDAICKQM